ncbi:MAG: ribbon-helix-helix domain-containing protein [Alphaproteobacteria bacterium]|nr:ribbon-helix-helix domain-containing protein [Alphaproteobacteria bacterium]
MLKKSVVIAGQHSTSISLEEEFFEELKKIASERKISLNQLVTEIDMQRKNINLSGAIRIFVLQYYKNKLYRQSI